MQKPGSQRNLSLYKSWLGWDPLQSPGGCPEGCLHVELIDALLPKNTERSWLEHVLSESERFHLTSHML